MRRAQFWRILVSSDLQSLVSKDTAVFTLRAILVLVQVIGYRAHRMSIDFTSAPVTVGDPFALLERLCGGAGGWQLAQKLGVC